MEKVGPAPETTQRQTYLLQMTLMLMEEIQTGRVMELITQKISMAHLHQVEVTRLVVVITNIQKIPATVMVLVLETH